MLSSYLFVLCMEVLSYSIPQSVGANHWKPFKVARNCPGISHVFFVVDLFLFGEVLVAQDRSYDGMDFVRVLW